MTKSYRSRNLWRRVQIAKSTPTGQPLLDETGKPVLAYGGLWFSIISTGADRMRIIPADPDAFFRQRAEEATAAHKARGRNVTVTPEEVYKLYTAKFTRPSETYAPPDQPTEFSIVLSKRLCINLTHGSSGAKQGNTADVLTDDMSVLLGLGGIDLPTEVPAATTSEEPTKKRKGKSVPELGPITMSDLLN